MSIYKQPNNILFEAQTQVAEILSADTLLSSVVILAENRQDIEFEIQKNLKNQGLVGVVMTPKVNYIGDYCQTSSEHPLAYELNPLEIVFTEYCPINRASNKDSCVTSLDAAVRTMEVLGKDRHGKFCPISIEQGETNGLLTAKASLKCMVVKETEP